ncbi:MAG: Gfo/Idh/MocA family oxidoreductase [Balneolaceae bacterium]|nr:Gfo/Idh/MocA family oxidoreductase [Balneolaceae bacterium]MBO6547865.1 Gfo/Idh/MocA family oxidoreductase [Balneolaceae bacterium]MBO6648378.1 Gfo/Idh/MocA family oxidoreductase [Balneolaceae bacterium]
MKRKDFIKSTGLVGAAALTSGFAGVYRSKEFNDISVGVIGTGDRGTGLSYLMKEIDGVEVTACSDIIPFRLKDCVDKATNGAKGYEDYRRILDDKNIDAIIIAVPYALHNDVLEDVIESGKHIYCEKTMIKGIQPAIDLVKRIDNYNQTFQVGHQYHSSRLYHRAVEIINSGYLGHIESIECQWNRNGDWRRPVPDPKWERMINWRMYREYSGGLAAELCSHQIDFCNWVAGTTPTKVSGFGGIDYWKDGRETYDNVHIMMQYPNGLNTKFTSLTTNSYERYQIKVQGMKGTMVINFGGAKIYLENLDEARATGLVDGVSGATSEAWSRGEGAPITVADDIDASKQALIDFKDFINNEEEPDSNVRTGANVSILVSMAIEAMDTNSVVEWKDEYSF